ncbi:MAG TPA: DUF4129 domain-containing protein [Acidimicrobiales bacterium]|nr:DUF4129 domain-containing protein [Acidimicrobiales bacterium]
MSWSTELPELSLHTLQALQPLFGWLDDLPVPREDPGTVRDLAEEILSRPEYRDPPKSLWERINDAVGEFVADLFELVGLGGGSVAPLVAWLVLFLLGGLIVFLVYWAVRSGVFGEGRPTRDQGDPVIVATDAHRSARDWLSEAERHEAEGRWSEGLLCRYRSLVVDLVAREVIPELVGRTAGEYVRDVAQRHPAGLPSFTAATELFETAWYGGAPTGPTERDRFVALATEVLDARAQPVGATT